MRTYTCKITIVDRYNDENPLTLEQIKMFTECEDLSKNGLEISKVEDLKEE